MSKQELSGRFKEPRQEWTNEEFVFTLAYYYFIYQTNTRISDLKSFANDLNSLSNKNRGYNSIKIRFSNYDAVNPLKESRGFKNTGKYCQLVWDKCINVDGTPKSSFISDFIFFINKYASNKSIYDSFILKYSCQKMIDKDDDNGFLSSADIETTDSFGNPDYSPKPKPKRIGRTQNEFERDKNVSKNALNNSLFCCDVDNRHETFLNKKRFQIYGGSSSDSYVCSR